jgi:predicted RNA-binding protein YlqC (UPF0109 family)
MGEMTELLQDFIINTTKQLVDEPKEVRVSISTSTKAIIAQIQVSKNDCGKIIGKKGRTIEALKHLCLAIKNTNFPQDSRKVMLEVLEDENSGFSYKDKS